MQGTDRQGFTNGMERLTLKTDDIIKKFKATPPITTFWALCGVALNIEMGINHLYTA